MNKTSKFLFSTLVAAMTSVAWAGEVEISNGWTDLKNYVDSDSNVVLNPDSPTTYLQSGNYGWQIEGIQTEDGETWGYGKFIVGENATLNLTVSSTALKLLCGASLEVAGEIVAAGSSGIELVGGTHTVAAAGSIKVESMTLSDSANLAVNGSVSLSQGMLLGDWSTEARLDVVNATVETGAGFFGIEVASGSVMNITDSVVTAGNISNFGVVNVYGNSTINAGSISGDKIVVTEGATLTVSSNSLLAMIDNSANEGSGNIAFNKVESAMTTKEITLKSVDGNAVQLAANAEITISSATEITDTAAIETLAGGVVLSAWDFVIDNAEAGVTVTMDVGDGLELESLRIYHEENGNWTDVTDVVTDKQLENGKLSFTTNSFSGYAAVAIPEPSMFGLLAGLGALALVGARRRRR